MTKYYDICKKIKQALTRPENFDKYFWVSFDSYSQKLIFGGKTGH